MMNYPYFGVSIYISHACLRHILVFPLNNIYLRANAMRALVWSGLTGIVYGESTVPFRRVNAAIKFPIIVTTSVKIMCVCYSEFTVIL